MYNMLSIHRNIFFTDIFNLANATTRCQDYKDNGDKVCLYRMLKILIGLTQQTLKYFMGDLCGTHLIFLAFILNRAIWKRNN